MEGEDGFSGYPNKLARTTTGLTIHPKHDSTALSAAITASFNNSNNPNDHHHHHQQQQQLLHPQGQALPPQGPQSAVREQDQYMPIANIIRIMRRILPPHAKISDEAKETIQECVSEYVSFITSEANERCHREQRKTITAVDLIWAMSKLGFDDYVGPLSLYLNRYRQSENDRSSSSSTSSHKEPMPMPRRGPAVDYGLLGMPVEHVGPVRPVGPVFNLGLQQGLYDPSMGGFLMEGSGSASGSSSSQANNNNNNNFSGVDPFAQFK